MKKRYLSLGILVLLIASCSPKLDLIKNEFPEEKAEIMKTFGEMAKSIKDGEIDKLISFHAYSPKFTEFKNGEPRNDGEANEAYERKIFGSVTEVVKFDAKDLKIAVYGTLVSAFSKSPT